jgi:hypothetical protein
MVFSYIHYKIKKSYATYVPGEVHVNTFIPGAEAGVDNEAPVAVPVLVDGTASITTPDPPAPTNVPWFDVPPAPPPPVLATPAYPEILVLGPPPPPAPPFAGVPGLGPKLPPPPPPAYVAPVYGHV